MKKIHIYNMISSAPNSWKVVLDHITQCLKKTEKYDIISNMEFKKYSIPGINDLSISFTDPPRIIKIPGRNRCILSVWDTTLLPPTWIPLLKSSKCKLLVPSNFCLDMYVNNGINKDKIIHFPHGVDSNIFYKYPNKKMILSNKKFIYGTVSVNHYRKGILELVESYLNTFSLKDDVCLVIKTTKSNYTPMPKWEFDVELEIDNLKKKYINPASIEIVFNKLDSMADFYNSIDVFVSATKAEGFFLPALEAMSCKIPIICTGYGGQLDFLNNENSYLIDYKLRNANENEEYYQYNKDYGSKLAEPDKEHLSYILKYIYENYEKALNKVSMYEKYLDIFTWENNVKIINNLIESIPFNGHK